MTEAFDVPSVPEVLTRSKIESSEHKGCDAFVGSHQSVILLEKVLNNTASKRHKFRAFLQRKEAV